MIWHTIFTAIFLVCLAVILIFGYASQTQKRVAKYKKSRSIMDLLKIFSKY